MHIKGPDVVYESEINLLNSVGFLAFNCTATSTIRVQTTFRTVIVITHIKNPLAIGIFC